jgi:hypothetical protein
MERILAYGHPNIRARHRTTMQLTKDEEISIRADCIIGVRADKSVCDLSEVLKRHLLEGGEIEIEIIVGELSFAFRAEGHPELKLSNPKDLVIRKSSYIDDRTLAIRATASSAELPREIVRALRDPETGLNLLISF